MPKLTATTAGATSSSGGARRTGRRSASRRWRGARTAVSPSPRSRSSTWARRRCARGAAEAAWAAGRRPGRGRRRGDRAAERHERQRRVPAPSRAGARAAGGGGGQRALGRSCVCVVLVVVCAGSTLAVPARPDLIVTGIAVSQHGATLSVTDVVRNRGGAPARRSSTEYTIDGVRLGARAVGRAATGCGVSRDA